jgi:hypothetical protein
MEAIILSGEIPFDSEKEAIDCAALIAIESVIFFARTERTPFNIPGKQTELFT